VVLLWVSGGFLGAVFFHLFFRRIYGEDSGESDRWDLFGFDGLIPRLVFGL
jgi:hypothetical protein